MSYTAHPLVPVACVVMFAILASANTGHTRNAYHCAVVMAACWFGSTLGHVG